MAKSPLSILFSLTAALCMVFPVSCPAAEWGSDAPEPQITRSAAPGVITIALIDTFSPDFYIHTFSPTVDGLMKALPKRKFRFVEIDPRNVPDGIDREKPDFIISAASTYVALVSSRGAHQIGTRISPTSNNVARSVGSTFVVRADSPFQSLADLEGKRIAVTDAASFEGWLIAQGELARQGLDPDDHFSEIIETQYGIPDVTTLVALSQAQAGVLPAGQYEQLIAAGVINATDLRVIAGRNGHVPLSSTDLYPDAVFASLPQASPEDVSAVTVALLSLQNENAAYAWQVCSDFVPTRDLLKTLALGPYSYLKDMSPEGLVRRFKVELILLVFFLLAIAFHIVTVNLLVRRRTAQLSIAVDEIRRSHDEAERSRKRIFTLERAGVVMQLSGLFAHEIKHPIMSIALYCGALRMYLKKQGQLSAKSQELLDAMDAEVERSSEIIEHVRSYAKKRERTIEKCNLSDIVREAAVTAGCGSIVWGRMSEAYVAADPFELQFVCANFIKNAKDAVKDERRPQIRVDIDDLGENWALSVTDNGPEVSDETFENLGQVTTSSKSEGLGFGLAIASGISEANGGYVKFERVRPHGIRATVVLRKAAAGKD